MTELDKAEKDGFDSAPNARLNYPDPLDPLFKEKEKRWIKGWERAMKMYENYTR